MKDKGRKKKIEGGGGGRRIFPSKKDSDEVSKVEYGQMARYVGLHQT